MPTPINSQIHSIFCTLAVLENLLINNIAKNPNVSLSQRELFNHFLEKYKINDITKNGLNLYAIYKFLKDDPEVSKSLVGRYSYFDFHNFFFHNLFNDKKLRMILFQMLVWTSLYFSTPVIMGTFYSRGMGHCISISEIRPNEDPFKTEYMIRDPDIWENNIRIGRELSINGNDLYSFLFNKEGIFGALLISTYVFGSIFIPSFINMMRENMPFFQSALGTIDRIPTPLISEDSIATEDDILNSNYLFDNELLNILFKNFM